MSEMSLPSILAICDNDADGFTCQMILRNLYKGSVQISTPDERKLTYTVGLHFQKIIFCDWAPSNFLEFTQRNTHIKHWALVDHHITNTEIPAFVIQKVDNNKCAAQLLLEFLNISHPVIQTYANYISINDIYKDAEGKAYPDLPVEKRAIVTRCVEYALRAKDEKWELSQFIQHLSECINPIATKDEIQKIREKDERVQNVIQNHIINRGDFWILDIIGEYYYDILSLIGYRASKDLNKPGAILCKKYWKTDHTTVYSVSFRSIDNTAWSLCKYFHNVTKACGFKNAKNANIHMGGHLNACRLTGFQRDAYNFWKYELQ